MPIARVMNPDVPVIEPADVPVTQGGGDQNGTQATSILHGQAGTGCAAINMPIKPQNAGGTTVTGVPSNAPLPPKPPG